MKFTPQRLAVALAMALLPVATPAATITITGGNAADITNALHNSSPGDIIEIGDSLTYDFSTFIAGYSPVVVSERTLRAAPGVQPTIYANPTPAAGVFSIFRLSGTATHPGTIQGLKFVSGPTAWLNEYVHVYFSKYVNIRNNEFTLQSLEANFNSGRAIRIEGSTATGPTILIEGNLFHTTAPSPYNAPVAVYTDGGASGFLARNNILDMSGRTNGYVYGFHLNNEGAFHSTTIINNTFVFANSASATNIGINLAVANPMVTGSIQNNLFLNAHIGYRDLNTSGSSTLTFGYNLLDNVSQIVSNQPADVITLISNYVGVGIAQLDSRYQPAYGSLAMNNGLNGLSYGAVDFWGDQRVRFGTVDIGAVEIPEPAALAGLAAAALLGLLRRREP